VSVVATGIDAAARAAAPVPPPARPLEAPGFAAQTSIFTMAPPPPPPPPVIVPVTGPAAAVAAADVSEPAPDLLEEVEIDLATAAEMLVEDEAPVAVPPPEPAVAEREAVVVPINAPPQVADERPMSLFERMMQMSRGKAKPAAEPTLAPEPPAAAADVDIPPFFKRQVNN
jgi:cell division protein FtsZ